MERRGLLASVVQVGALALALGCRPAQAAKVPVQVNVGLGPSVTAVSTGHGAAPVSYGLSLSVEGWVSKEVLRSKAVRRRIPKQYRAMVRGMDDLHVRPVYTWVVPDTVMLGPLTGSTELRGASWAPLSLFLVHQVSPVHLSVAVEPRVAWLNLSAEGIEANRAWLGLSLSPGLETDLSQRVGLAVGGSVGVGYAQALPEALGGPGVPWLLASAHARLQVRVPLEVKI